MQRPSFIIPLYHVLTSASLHHQNIKEGKPRSAIKESESRQNDIFIFDVQNKRNKKFSPSTKQTKTIRKELLNSDIFHCCLFLRFTRQHIFLKMFKEMSQTKIPKRKEEFVKLSARPPLTLSQGPSKVPSK